jgi:hypothetical protein
VERLSGAASSRSFALLRLGCLADSNNWQGIELFVAPYGNIDDFEGTVFSFAPGRAPLKGIDPETNYRLHLSGGSAWDD